MLHDRLVVGISNPILQRKSLSELHNFREAKQHQSTYFVKNIEDDQDEPSKYLLFTVNTCANVSESDLNAFTVTMLINKQPVGMQVDAGAAVSIMSEVAFKYLFSKRIALL